MGTIKFDYQVILDIEVIKILQQYALCWKYELKHWSNACNEHTSLPRLSIDMKKQILQCN